MVSEYKLGDKILELKICNFFIIIKLLRTIKKDHSSVIVHTHSTKAGLVGRWAAWFAGIPTRIHTIHGFSFHEYQPKFFQLIHKAIEWVTSIITTQYICVSNADAQTATTFIPNFSQKQIIIRAAVDEEKFLAARSTEKIKNDNFIIGTVACFKPQKNLFDLLRAFKNAYSINDRLRLEIIGDGLKRTEIESWINQENLQYVITLHGWQENVAPFMKRWNLFALSSLWEGLPCAVVEARLVGLPVVAYQTGGIPEVIQDGVNGILIKKKEWETLAQSFLLLSKNSTIYHNMCNHQENLNSFKQTEMVNNHIALYRAATKKIQVLSACIALICGTIRPSTPPSISFHIQSGSVAPCPNKNEKPVPFSGPSGKQHETFEAVVGLRSLFKNVNRIIDAPKQRK